MSNDVQSHESVVERVPGEERRASPRHAASALGAVTARIIGGSPVDLVNFSARGVLFECDSRLLIGARASVRITTTDANMVVSGRVVRSRVKGLVNGALRYDAALALDHELTLRPVPTASDEAPAAFAHANGGDDAGEDVSFESEIDGSFDPAPVEAYLAESEASLAEVARQDDPESEAIALFEGASHDDGAAAVNGAADGQPADLAGEPVDLHVEVAIRATLEEAETAAPAIAASEAVEAAAEVAFEPAGEFVFEEAPELAFTPVTEAAVEMPPELPVAPAWEPAAAGAIEPEPAGEPMFDATPFVPPAEEAVEGSSMFETTLAVPAYESSASSMFDARPSDSWREPGTPEPSAETGEPAVDTGEPAAMAGEPAAEAAGAIAEPAADDIDFETDVTFETDDAVMFQSVFEVEVEAVAADPEPEPEAIESAAAIESVAAPEPPEAAVEEAASAEPPVTAPDDDRALVPFTATVPHHLADLHRIAADNQW